MSRQPEVPRWRRNQQPATVVVPLKGKAARQYAQAIARQAQYPVQPSAYPPVPGSTLLARTGGFRFRKHLVPFGWLAVMAVTGLALPLPAALLAAGLTALLIVAFSWRLPKKVRLMSRAAAGLTLLLVPLLSAYGWTKPWPVVLALGWLTVAVPWVAHYRWRPSAPPEPRETSDHERWEALAEEKKWNGHLGPAEMLPGGGRRFPIQLDGIKTTIRNVLGASENVAGAWHKPMTEVYAERSPDGITSRGFLTVLGQDTLMRVREWGGKGIDPADGTAVIARYADGKDARVKFYTPRYGTRHALISGTTGSGKTETMNELLFIALTSGFIVPCVLDPQEGQSLPYWRDKVLYARGVSECTRMLRGLHAGMMDRSGYLADLEWDDGGMAMRGMGFFDHELTGLPVVLILFDEAHMVLSGSSDDPQSRKDCRDAVRLTTEIGRLGRKTGVALWLGTHLPSLSDLGGEQALRDMLRGGNVIGLRTANSVAGGMLGLQKDPAEIPPYFADGRETYGLGYLAGPDNRPDAPMRTDLVPKAKRSNPPAVPALDDRFAAAMARAMAAGGVPLGRPVAPPAPAVAVVPEPEGRTAADAVWIVLRADGGEMTRGEIFKAAAALAVEQWGRAKHFEMRAIQDACNVLTEGLNGRRITKVKHGLYCAGRVGASAGAPGGEG